MFTNIEFASTVPVPISFSANNEFDSTVSPVPISFSHEIAIFKKADDDISASSSRPKSIKFMGTPTTSDNLVLVYIISIQPTV